MRDHLLAVVTRNFGGKHFELSKFVTSMAGAPAKAFLANGFGEAEKCVMNAAMGDSAGSAEDDRRLYPWFQLAMLYMVVADVPTLDFGFAESMMWFVTNVTLFSAMNAPLSWATRCVCKALAHAQRLREKTLAYPSNTEDIVLQYQDSEAVTQAKSDLMDWCSKDQSTVQIQWDRCALASGRQPPGARGGSSNPRGSGQQPSGGKQSTPRAEKKLPKSVAFEGNKRYSAIDQRMWKANYGTLTDGGKQTVLCWFHANRPGGCSQMSKCQFDHTAYPDFYKGVSFEKLPAAAQQEVLGRCARA